MFDSVKWTHKTRGVFRGGFSRVQFLNCVTDRSPPINGQMPCLTAPRFEPVKGKPPKRTIGNLVYDCLRLEAIPAQTQ